MKKVIITGASGFIGKALVKRLLSEKVEVFALVRNESKMQDLINVENLHLINADMNEYKNLPNLIKERNFDAFFHLAWDGTFNYEYRNYTKQLLSAIYTCDALISSKSLNAKKFIFTSSVNQYTKFNEENITNRDIYSTAAKSAWVSCCALSKDIMVDFCTIALAMPFGEGNFFKTIPNVLILNLLDNKSPKLVEGKSLFDLIYIEDVVDGMISIAKFGKSHKTYYLGNRKLRTFKELISNVGNILNPKVKLLFGEYKNEFDIDYSDLDLEALYNDTGFEPKIPLEQSILKTANWLKTQKDFFKL